jgi:hypothetical protein
MCLSDLNGPLIYNMNVYIAKFGILMAIKTNPYARECYMLALGLKRNILFELLINGAFKFESS